MEPHCAKRSLLVLLCTVVTAAIPVRLAAADAASQDFPVPGGTVALARTLGIDPVPDRGRFIAEVTEEKAGQRQIKRSLLKYFNLNETEKSQAERLLNAVTLYRSLGGGWKS